MENNEQQPIEPEIVDNATENIEKTNSSKKVWAWIWLIASIIYGVSPIDVSPDVAPVIGWLDDLLIFGAAATNFIQQQFFQGNDTLNKIFKIAKWILISLATLIFLIIILIITLIVKS